MICPYDHTQDALYEAKHQCMLKNDIVIHVHWPASAVNGLEYLDRPAYMNTGSQLYDGYAPVSQYPLSLVSISLPAYYVQKLL